MGHMAWRRTFGLEVELEVADDLIDGLGIFDERDDLHLTSARRAQQGVELVDLADHLAPLFPTVGTADAGKATHRIAAVEILLNHFLDYRTEIPVLLFKTILIFSKKPLKIIKEHTIKNRVFRMMLPVDPCHGSRKEPQRPDTPGVPSVLSQTIFVKM